MTRYLLNIEAQEEVSMSILSKSKKIILLLAVSLCSVSLAGAEPIIDSEAVETAAAPYYNLSLSVPTDRNSGYDPARAMVNGVQNQGIYGTCWAFAAVAAAESSVYKQLQQEGIPYNVETNPVKYSPWYLAWIKSALPTEVDSSDARLHSGKPEQKDYLRPFAQKVYKGGISGIDAEFNIALGPIFKEIDVHDKTALIAPENYVEKTGVHLHNVFNILCDHPEEMKKPENMQRIKELVVSCGAVVAGVSAHALHQSGAVDFYTDRHYPVDHAVTLIGWDDEYDFSKSGMRVKPKKKGAWILRNSWGADWGDKGDYYLSYEDCSFEDVAALDVDVDRDCFDYIGTHEDSSSLFGKKGLPPVPVQMKKNAAFAAGYTARGEDNLVAVGAYAMEDGMSYRIRVYKDCQDFIHNTKAPDYQQEGTFGEDGTPAWNGYRMVELAQPVALAQGEEYVVEMSLFTRDGKGVFVVATDDSDKLDQDLMTSYINEGDGRWQKVLNRDGRYHNDIFSVGSVIERVYLKHIK